jgi:hypothetical protein
MVAEAGKIANAIMAAPAKAVKARMFSPLSASPSVFILSGLLGGFESPL